MAACTAASLAKADPMNRLGEHETGYFGLYCSFHFCFSPSLLLIGHWREVTLSIVTAVIGAIFLGVGLVGYLFRPVGIMQTDSCSSSLPLAY